LALNVYEGVFILDSNRYARNPGGVAQQISDLVKRQDGELLASRLWNEQKLAYSIKGHTKGTYWLTYFRMDSSKLSDFNHQSKLNDNVIRSLVLKIDPRLVDALVEHTLGGPTPASSGEDAADADKKPNDSADHDKDETAAVADGGNVESTS